MLRSLPLVLATALPSLAPAQTLRVEAISQPSGQLFMAVEFAPGVPDTLYIVERTGLVLRFTNGQFDPVPFLDITDRVQIQGEGGFLGLVFDPDFQANGFVYASYTTNSTHGDSVVSRFSVSDPVSAIVADPASETILFGPFAHAGPGHKSGDLEFGPDGMLYFSFGDGNTADELPMDPSQILSDPRGSILRFDVDAPFPHVPADNPFVGTPNAEPLIWAYGLRNPFRFDIDPVTGDLFTGDVGSGFYEEVNWLPASEPGLNFGWRCREGYDCTGSPACTCPAPQFRDPIAALEHSPTSPICAVAGGVFISGGSIPGLENTYLFSDFCSGYLYAILDPTGSATLLDLSDDFIASNGQPIRYAVDFEQAPNGDIYFVTLPNGRVWRILPPEDFGTYCVAAPNSTGAAASIEASGSPSIAARNLVFDVNALPTDAFGLFLMSRTTTFLSFPVGDGNLCVGMPLFRWGPVFDSGPTGSVTRATDLTDLPPMVTVQSGETWYFQYWSRDATPAPSSNTSNGASVRFVD